MSDELAVADPPVPDEAEVVAEARPADAVRLLRQYREKIAGLVAAARPVRPNRSPFAAGSVAMAVLSGNGEHLRREEVWREARTAFLKLQAPATDLARYASGLIERSRLAHLTKLELRLLLAEFEAELENASELFRRS